MELQRKIQVNFLLLIVCLCMLSSITTYIIVKSEPTITQSQNVCINKNDNEKKKTNINTATVEELKTLPSIDTKKANLIINNRPFTNIYDIVKIKGIGNETMEKVENLIIVKE